MAKHDKNRCSWVTNDEIYIEYHDKEWGQKVKTDEKLFEFLVLESFQAGLSWLTILKKRENFRIAFDNFDYNIISTYNLDKVNKLINNEGIIRNRNKIESTIVNAKLFIEIQKEFGSFYNYIVSFIGSNTIYNHCKNYTELPTKTHYSDQISHDLKTRGFKFMGSTIVYAFLQATGFVNDHTHDCFLNSNHSQNTD
jgi:DNA-3-methyladenine glycosylase I